MDARARAHSSASMRNKTRCERRNGMISCFTSRRLLIRLLDQCTVRIAPSESGWAGAGRSSFVLHRVLCTFGLHASIRLHAFPCARRLPRYAQRRVSAIGLSAAVLISMRVSLSRERARARAYTHTRTRISLKDDRFAVVRALCQSSVLKLTRKRMNTGLGAGHPGLTNARAESRLISSEISAIPIH